MYREEVRHDPCPQCGGDLLYVGDVELRVLSLFRCERCAVEYVAVADQSREAVNYA
jgi:hypothetical protein